MVDTNRAQRISDEVRREVGRLLVEEAKDPRVKLVSITSCEVSRDLSHAKLFFTMADEAPDLKVTMAGLDKASGFLRSRIAELLDLRKTPKLRFVYDSSVAEGRRLSRLIDDAVAGIKATDTTDPNGPK